MTLDQVTTVSFQRAVKVVMASLVNEDELLRTPDVESQDEIDREELPTDDRVGEDFDAKFDKLACNTHEPSRINWGDL